MQRWWPTVVPGAGDKSFKPHFSWKKERKKEREREKSGHFLIFLCETTHKTRAFHHVKSPFALYLISKKIKTTKIKQANS
jgi:hypothetical protein